MSLPSEVQRVHRKSLFSSLSSIWACITRAVMGRTMQRPMISSIALSRDSINLRGLVMQRCSLITFLWEKSINSGQCAYLGNFSQFYGMKLRKIDVWRRASAFNCVATATCIRRRGDCNVRIIFLFNEAFPSITPFFCGGIGWAGCCRSLLRRAIIIVNKFD